mgnify:FL=1
MLPITQTQLTASLKVSADIVYIEIIPIHRTLIGVVWN